MDSDKTQSLRILLIGSGGREHALAWRLAKSQIVEAIYVAPGNGGISTIDKKISNVNIGVNDFNALVEFAQHKNVNLLVPGPEIPLVEGIEGWFRKGVGIPCFGPTKAAARIEGSKIFSKDFMIRHNIPTASSRNISSYPDAEAFVKTLTHKIVIKASGLAAGKGVIIPLSKEEELKAVKDIMVEKVFGEAGDEIVIEDFLEGEEISILAFSDGYTIVPLPAAQDHKRIFDGDKGPNTGGMGCYAPAPVATNAISSEIQRTILQPTIDGMRRDGYPFVGLLFVGLMLTASGPKVLEYNVRFGDPEAQTLLPLLSEEVDLAEVMLACVERRLDSVKIDTKPAFSVTIVAAAGGYPEKYAKGNPIKLESSPPDTFVFHGGTAIDKSGQLVTAGGRVIAATATALNLQDAVSLAYDTIKTISFDEMFYRRDIAYRAFIQQKIPHKRLTYADAGVSIDAGNLLVERIRAAVRSTRRAGADAEIGGFGGLFDLKAAGYKDPILVASVDGIGTKLKIAHYIGKHNTIGIDLVAMNVNDLIVQGAESLFFVDYYACGKLDVDVAVSFVEGVADGCRTAGCALIGGETAEMPSLYHGEDYDGAGTAVGAVERDELLPRDDIKAGDVLLGLSSSGCHSNGFSLIRKIVDHAGLKYSDPAPWDRSKSVGTALLEPTRIYVKSMLRVTKKKLIKGASHITGGGFIDNVPRMLPKHLAAEIDVGTWTVSPVFKWLGKSGGVIPEELFRTFNMGIGMVIVVSADEKAAASKEMREAGETVFEIGRVVECTGDDSQRCLIQNSENWSG